MPATNNNAPTTPGKSNESFLDEFDGDAEFEAALMALNLGTPCSKELHAKTATAGDSGPKESDKPVE